VIAIPSGQRLRCRAQPPAPGLAPGVKRAAVLRDDPSNFALTLSHYNRSKQATDLRIARILARFDEIKEGADSDDRGANLNDVLKAYAGTTLRQVAFDKSVQRRLGSSILLTLVAANRTRIFLLVTSARLPSIVNTREHAEAGALISYGPSFPALFRRAAEYVDKILRGAKPSELPVEQPTKYDLVINLITAQAIGLNVSPTLLARADQVIE
jgi:ABC transporter substrate binding protein